MVWGKGVISIKSGRYSRKHFSGSGKRRKIADLAIDEFQVWNSGKTKETNPAMQSHLSKYWAASGSKDYGYSAAWSAAFISWLFKTTGAGNQFPYASAHNIYIREAVKNRKAGVKKGILGYRPAEHKVRVGDLICYPRQSGVTYDSDHAYKSHCDLIVDIDRRTNQAITIGGNVSDSVSKSIYQLSPEGYVIDKKVHVVLKNQT